MNVSTFLKHWSIVENPFMAEEARQDDVLARLRGHEARHPDFSKIAGDLGRPASAVVFGEKGSGKTAIRLQLQDEIEKYNARHPAAKTLIIAYDELNPVLDRFARRVRAKTALATLEQLRLVDHIDGLLSVAVPDLVDALLGKVGEGHVELGADARSIAAGLDRAIRRDWVILQALFDRPDQAVARGRRLRRAVRFHPLVWARPIRWLTIILWAAVACVGGLAAYMHYLEPAKGDDWRVLVSLSALLVLALVTTTRVLIDFNRLRRIARQVSAQLRVLDRSADSFRASFERVPWDVLDTANLPVDDLDEPRYALLDRLRRAVVPFGFVKIIVLVDRVDEPTMVSGETERMKAVIWPVFNNKFLQQKHLALKMMLPLELRHELYRQSSDFFQEARLDKQNMIEKLTWSGAMLYDLCTTRLCACLEDGADEISLTDFFDDSVNRQDIVDALDQMRQPRDAFKMMYQLIQEHCSTSTRDQADFRIPKLVLDQVRRKQADRIDELHRGMRPA